MKITSGYSGLMPKAVGLFFTLFLLAGIACGQDSIPAILTERYRHDSIVVTDHSEDVEGYVLYEPAAPRPDSAPVIVFHHGYGAINPSAYGGWIRHLVRQGNIVIFPRYQVRYFKPAPRKFPFTAAAGIRSALDTLYTPGHVRPVTDLLIMVGHSYGGAISAYMGVHFEELGIPQPKGLFLCAAGTGFFCGARLRSYAGMPPETHLLVFSNEQDNVVGQRFQKRIFQTAVQASRRNFILQRPDRKADPVLTAYHDECYSLDPAFDNGLYTPTVGRYRRYSRTNALDYFGYWKLLDALSDCLREGKNCHVAFGNTPEQRSLGVRPNGIPYRELEVTLPEER